MQPQRVAACAALPSLQPASRLQHVRRPHPQAGRGAHSRAYSELLYISRRLTSDTAQASLQAGRQQGARVGAMPSRHCHPPLPGLLRSREESRRRAAGCPPASAHGWFVAYGMPHASRSAPKGVRHEGRQVGPPLPGAAAPPSPPGTPPPLAPFTHPPTHTHQPHALPPPLLAGIAGPAASTWLWSSLKRPPRPSPAGSGSTHQPL